MRNRENTNTAIAPTTVEIGAIPAKNVPAKGTFIKANPAKIQASIKKIHLSILFPPFYNHGMYKKGGSACH